MLATTVLQFALKKNSRIQRLTILIQCNQFTSGFQNNDPIVLNEINVILDRNNIYGFLSKAD